ncbi:hypothetical protein [Paenibacillus sp. NPDC057934]|uniref:hypothetical protein n=1 Tax=Paenibacillus sp. NPDC057934 TaxID=3346282 RepID=UPI0036D7C6B3
MSMSKIGLIGDFDAEVAAHIAIPQAIQLASQDLGRYFSLNAQHSKIWFTR